MWRADGRTQFAPTRVSFILETSATVRKHSVGRGFEEVYKRAGHKLKSVPHKWRTKTPLRRTKNGSTLFALPSMGSNPFCWGVLGVLALAVEGERVQNKISANFKVSQAPSVKCSAFATSLSEGGFFSSPRSGEHSSPLHARNVMR